MFMRDFLLILGMELFEEALIKWEQALNIRHQAHSTSSNNSLALQGATSEDLPVVIIIHKYNKKDLESISCCSTIAVKLNLY